jgi:anthranilate phosphoribosyltransferase
VLAELGVNINASIAQVEACLDELGLCFCFAPLMHPSMKHVAAVRKRLGIRTIFNILGPLVNPAGACYQLLGAGRPALRPLLAGALTRIGTKRTFVVAGDDGLGDVTLSGKTFVSEVVATGELSTAGSPVVAVREFTWTPEDFGISRGSLESLTVAGPDESASIIRRLLGGELGPARDIVILNAAAALIVAGKTSEPTAAAAIVASAIDSGAATSLLAQLVVRSHEPAP